MVKIRFHTLTYPAIPDPQPEALGAWPGWTRGSCHPNTTLPAPEFLPVLWAVAKLVSACAGLD
jgi:hypothetical protein